MLLLLILSACSNSPQTTLTPIETPVPDDLQPTPSSTLEFIPPTPTPSITPTPDCRTAGGEYLNAQFSSEMLGRDLYYSIYLPPCYDIETDQRYPVVYLLHGLSYANDQWLHFGVVETMDALIAGGEISPFIIVLPLEESFIPPQTSPFADAIVDDLIPWVDAHYRTLPEKEFRGIGGVSRGAAWSLRIGLTHCDVFNSVGAHSLPLFEADGANIFTWVTQTPIEDLPTFFIDIGRNDQEWKTAQDVADLLDEYNIAHEWYLFTGDHTESYWSSHLEQYLRWYARDW